MHDLVIRGGTVIDGTGAAARTADVAIDGELVVAVGDEVGRARREIDADGLLVLPGVVDIHTHYDGQATWDPELGPSSWHGVTTVIMGNCGVGFAPAAPDRHEWLISLMEQVEDIPGTALTDGMTWNWESFPEYLDELERFPRVVDVATHVPHCALRAYVMDERGARNEPATEDDISAMARLVREALQAGALGVSMSRTLVHRAVDGEPIPGTFAAEAEIFGIAAPMGEIGHGVLELASAGATGDDLSGPEREIEWMTRLAKAIRRPISFAIVQHLGDPLAYRRLLDLAAEAQADGAALYPQTHGRCPSLLVGLRTRLNPFRLTSLWRDWLVKLPWDERIVRMQNPDIADRLVAEADAIGIPYSQGYLAFERLFPLGDPPDYEPGQETSVAAVAAQRGVSPFAVALEMLLRRNGTELLLLPALNYVDFNLDAVREMLEHPTSVLGVGDGGAHAQVICDASVPTTMLQHWARDRVRGKLPLELVVRKMCRDTALLYGLEDRGALLPGLRADLNLVDFDNLRMRPPRQVNDLPTGAERLVQEADGWMATICAGQVVREKDEPTGARPGRLVRGPQAPAER